MKQNNIAKSMKIRTILGEKNRYRRLEFTHYVVREYGINLNTSYTRFRKGILSNWMIIGIRGCICEYLGDDAYTDFENFYKNLEVKSDFVRFMSEEMGMCERTVRKRFKMFNFSELELIGLEAVFEDFMCSIKKETETI